MEEPRQGIFRKRGREVHVHIIVWRKSLEAVSRKNRRLGRADGSGEVGMKIKRYAYLNEGIDERGI